LRGWRLALLSRRRPTKLMQIKLSIMLDLSLTDTMSANY
jgi:hypothetical protein